MGRTGPPAVTGDQSETSGRQTGGKERWATLARIGSPDGDVGRGKERGCGVRGPRRLEVGAPVENGGRDPDGEGVGCSPRPARTD